MHSLITLVIDSIPNPPFKVRWGPVNKIRIFWENDYTTGNNNHQVQGILASNSICFAHCLLESLPVGTGILKILNILSLCVCAAFREARGCPKGMDLRHRPQNYSSTWRGHKIYYCFLHLELFHAITEFLGIGVIFGDTLSKNWTKRKISRGEEGHVCVEDHEGVLVGVAAEEEGTWKPIIDLEHRHHHHHHHHQDHLPKRKGQECRSNGYEMNLIGHVTVAITTCGNSPFFLFLQSCTIFMIFTQLSALSYIFKFKNKCQKSTYHLCIKKNQ